MFEIPTGVAADVVGRRSSVIVGLFVSGVASDPGLFMSEHHLVVSPFPRRASVTPLIRSHRAPSRSARNPSLPANDITPG